MRKKENFYRICTAIVDHGKDALVMLLEKDLKKRNESYEDFINRHQHEIHHLCYNRGPCCQCTGRAVPTGTPDKRVLYPVQLNIILDTKRKCNCQKVRKVTCCKPAKQGLTVKESDLTLLRCLLVNCVPDYLTQSYCTARKAVDDLLFYRNTLYGHAESGEIDNATYNKNITDISNALLTIATFCGKKASMEEKLNGLKTLPYSEDQERKYQTMLIEEFRRMNDYSKKIEHVMKRTISEVGLAQTKIIEEGHNKVLKRLDSMEQGHAESRRREEESSGSKARIAVVSALLGGGVAEIGRRLYNRWNTPSTSKDDSS